MAIGSIGGDFSLLQSYLSSCLSLNKYVPGLMEQNKTPFSSGSSYFNSSSYFGDSASQKLKAVSSNAVELQSQIGRMASLTQYTSGDGKEASYSNEGILSASVAKYASVSSFTNTKVNVTQLASGQQNKSADLDANENSFGDQFSIGITDSTGKTSTFTVDLGEQDNNKTAMQTMADEINASNIGIRATLTENGENGTVNLQLSSAKTGETNGKFTVTGENIANLDNVVNAAQNANYSVNGKEFSSQSNEVRIMEGVTATLNKTGSTEISYVTDSSPAVGAVQKFLDTFNNLLDAASGTQVKNQLTNEMANSIRGLGYSGIGVDSSGKLSINDTDKLNESISNGSFARNFQGQNSFGDRLYDVASNAQNTVYRSMLQESFKDLMNNFMNSSSQSTYGGNAGTAFFPGMIFSMWA